MDEESDEERPMMEDLDDEEDDEEDEEEEDEHDDHQHTAAAVPTADVDREKEQIKLIPGCVSKQYLDRLVMNLLIVEGRKEAAKAFAQESGIEAPMDVDAMESRMQVRSAILEGDLQGAITHITDRDAQILERNPRLHFDLQVQHLIELIRDNKVTDALGFARQALAPLGEGNREYLRELEEALTLLAFKDPNTSPLAHLLDTNHRLKVAREANAAMLTHENQNTEPVLLGLLKHLAYAEAELSKSLHFPRLDWFPPCPEVDDLQAMEDCVVT